MRLEDLLQDTNIVSPLNGMQEIRSLTLDSRDVVPGSLFAALKGDKTDGRFFIKQAMEKGSSIILMGNHEEIPYPSIKVDNPRKYFAYLSAKFFEYMPSHIVAVTGTNGKTSVAEFCRQIWTLTGKKAASLGTLGVISPYFNKNISHTTPDAVVLHEILRDLYFVDVTHLALEISSHSLAQYRVDGVKLKSAGFTNLSHDHLDYHSNVEAYLNVKTRLFTEVLDKEGVVVINGFSQYSDLIRRLACEAGRHCFMIGHDNTADLVLTHIDTYMSGLDFSLTFEGCEARINTSVMGHFQAENIAVAVGLCMVDGLSFDEIVSVLPNLHAASGRMEKIIVTPQGAVAYVDYAHTPDALKNALLSLRKDCTGRLICVFGCGGERDVEKRPKMGKIVTQYADIAIVTDDNPRHESAPKIRSEILVSCPQAYEIEEREQAIAFAFNMAQSGDIILIAGKGHETGQIIGDETIPFSDQDILKTLRCDFSQKGEI